MTTTTPGLPTPIRSFLAAHVARDAETALRAFIPDAVVVDDGSTYRGTAEVRDFLSRAGSEFTYTTTLIGVEQLPDEEWVAVNRIEGDFPGGVADLRYRFTMRGELIAALTIAP
jgi:ketosteroid isomerase-like protein